MLIIFMLLTVVMGVLLFYESKKRGYKVPMCIVMGGVTIACGIIVYLVLNLNAGMFHDFKNTYDIFGGVSIGICVELVFSLIILKVLPDPEPNNAKGVWRCPHCGQDNSDTMKVCDCGTRKPHEV